MLAAEEKASRGDCGGAIAIVNSLDLNGFDSDGLKRVGDLLVDVQDLRRAEEVYSAALSKHPHNLAAINNLALLMVQIGRDSEAALLYEHILLIDPKIEQSRANLASLRFAQGKIGEAVEVCRPGLRSTQFGSELGLCLTNILRNFVCKAYDRELEIDLKVLFRNPDIDHELLAPITASLLNVKPCLKDTLRFAEQNPTKISIDDIYRLQEEDLLLLLLSSAIAADTCIEALCSALRRAFLIDIKLTKVGVLTKLLLAVAKQCLMTEFIYFVDPQEAQELEILKRNLERCEGDYESWSCLVMVGACYSTIPDLGTTVRQRLVSDQVPAPLRELAKMHLDLPEAIDALERVVSHSNSSQVSHNTALAHFYDRYPYPSPRRVIKHDQQSLLEYIRYATGRPILLPQGEHRRKVLVAGCGTGVHALGIASQISDGDVVGIDLSKRSIAFATYYARLSEVDNATFLVGDFQHSHRGQSYDVIECVGVLHHIADPKEALLELVGQLRDGGLMRIGVYSKAARERLKETKQYLPCCVDAPNVDQIRELRRVLRGVRHKPFLNLLSKSRDFYSMSGIQDLLFNPLEHHFDIDGIVSLLDNTGLTFLRFDLPVHDMKYLYQAYPMLDLSYLQDWKKIEDQYPMVFAGMYQFWVHLNSSGRDA